MFKSYVIRRRSTKTGPKHPFFGMFYFFDAGIPHDMGAWHLSNSYVISLSVALWVVSLCFAVVCAVTWELLLGDTPDSLVPTTPMSFALSIYIKPLQVSHSVCHPPKKIQ